MMEVFLVSFSRIKVNSYKKFVDGKRSLLIPVRDLNRPKIIGLRETVKNFLFITVTSTMYHFLMIRI